MRIALSPTTPGLTADRLVAMCVAAEEWGYREAWLSEVSGPEAFTMAGAVATATSRMELGVAVVPAVTRTPAVLAMGSVTVSHLLEGRPFHLGIGSSSELIVSSWHGRPFHPPFTLVRETLAATAAALAGRRDHEGSHITMSRFTPWSRATGPVDLYVGALGERMLRLAGTEAAGVCLNLMPPQAVVRQRSAITEAAAAAGRSPHRVRMMARLHVVPNDDVDAARAVVRHGFAPYFAQPVYNRFLAWCGFPEEAAAIAAGFADGDRERVAAAMHTAVVDAVAVVGSLSRIRGRLEEYDAAGLDVAALNVISSDPVPTLAALGPKG